MPEPLKEELCRLAAGLKEFINYQRRLGLQLLEGSYPVSIVKPAAAVAASPEPTAVNQPGRDTGRNGRLPPVQTLAIPHPPGFRGRQPQGAFDVYRRGPRCRRR